MYKSISKKLNDAVMSVVSGQALSEGSKEEYEKFFRAALKKFGAESPADLDDEKKKEFFNYVEKNYKGEKTDENFGQRAHKAKKEGKDTFEYQGKTYNVKESIKKYTFSVEEDDPDSAEKKKDDNSVIDNTKNSKAKAEEDSVDEDAEEGNISPETVNAVIKLLNKRKLENKKAKTEEDEKEEDDDKDKKSSGKSTVPKEKSPDEERKEEGRPPIKLSGKKDKVNVTK